jgi:hypothetical protein
MSVVRWGESGSKVYIIGMDKVETGWHWECVGCNRPGNYGLLPVMVEHLRTEHIAKGDCVPEFVFERLARDDAT